MGGRGKSSKTNPKDNKQGFDTPVGSKARFELEKDVATRAAERYNQRVRKEQDKEAISRAKTAQKRLDNDYARAGRAGETPEVRMPKKASENDVYQALSARDAVKSITKLLPDGSYKIHEIGLDRYDIETGTSLITVSKESARSVGGRTARNAHIQVSASKLPDWWKQWR